MPTILLDRSHISNDSLIDLAENTNITHLSFGSISRVIHDILNSKLESQLQLFENNIDKGVLRGASGGLLDLFGEAQGIDRTPAKSAFVSSEEQNFNFYTLEPDFGSINGGQDIVIPKGSVRVTNSSEEDVDNVVYVNTEDIVLPAAENKIFFSARSLNRGNEVNVGENTLTFHSFTNYADSLNNSLLITNSSAITSGRPELDDDSYRFLISQQPLAKEKANTTAIRTGLLQIPGIASVTRIPFRRGIGTVDWIIKAVTPTVSSQLLTVAQNFINETASDGMDNRAVAPDTVGLQLFFTLTYTENLENREKSRIKETIRRNLTTAVNGLDIGEPLLLDQLINVILNSSEKIARIGTSKQKFDKLVIYVTSQLTNSRLKKVLLGDFDTRPQQRVIIEPNVETPISIFDNN